MSVLEATDSVQFTVDQAGRVTAVVLTPELWQRVVEALEDSVDRRLVLALRDRLAAGPQASRALRWDDIADEWT